MRPTAGFTRSQLTVEVDLVEMANGEGWLWRPVLNGMCKAESLLDGSLDLEIIASMNEALDVDQENRIRIEKAMRENHGG